MWHSSGELRVWRSGNFSATVDLSQPGLGLQAIQIGDDSVLMLRPLQLTVGRSDKGQSDRGGKPASERAMLREAYVRHNDLVAAFTESTAHQFAPQVYWRMMNSASGGRIASLEVMVSVQTTALETTTAMQVATDIGPGEIVRCEPDQDGRISNALVLDTSVPYESSTPAVVLFRPAGVGWSYAEMVYATDFRNFHLAPLDNEPDWNRVTWALFTEHLEKGVIRRGRMRAVWLPRENDQELLQAEYFDFINGPLPLTT